MTCEEDDGRDPTLLVNPWFWLILIACASVWGVVIWAFLS